MQTSKVLVTLINRAEFELFGSFIERSKILLSYSDNYTFKYECTLDEYQTLLAKTQYRASVTDV